MGDRDIEWNSDEYDEPHQDPDLLYDLYYEQRHTMEEMTDILDCSYSTLYRWMEEYEYERKQYRYERVGGGNKTKDDTSYRDEDVLRRLYHEEGLTTTEICDKFDISMACLIRWFDEHGIERNGQLKDKPPKLRTDKDGYEEIITSHINRSWHLRPHRLLAVAEYGFDGVCDKVVHHKNEIPWDNRPENIELMDVVEHSKYHNSPKEQTDA